MSQRGNVDHDRGVVDKFGWIGLLGRAQSDRDGVLVAAHQPLGGIIVELARARGYDALASSTPLEVVHDLERRGDRITHAIVTSALPWADELQGLLAESYPHILRIMIVSELTDAS